MFIASKIVQQITFNFTAPLALTNTPHMTILYAGYSVPVNMIVLIECLTAGKQDYSTNKFSYNGCQ